jgi:hypothetical protein
MSLNHLISSVDIDANFNSLKVQGVTVTPSVNVICKCYNSTTVNNGDIILTNKLIDTHNAYNLVTGKYTIPVAGNYYISGLYQSNNQSFNINGYLELYINYNNTGVFPYNLIGGNRSETTGNINRYVQGSSVFAANAGDTVSLYKNAQFLTAPINCVFAIIKI